MLLCADLPDNAGTGPGERNFAALLAAHAPEELLELGLREPLGAGGQRAYVVARLLRRFRLAVVGAVEPAFLAPLGLAAFDSVDAALAAEDARLGRRAGVLAVADAMAAVVHRAPLTHRACRRFLRTCCEPPRGRFPPVPVGNHPG